MHSHKGKPQSSSGQPFDTAAAPHRSARGHAPLEAPVRLEASHPSSRQLPGTANTLSEAATTEVATAVSRIQTVTFYLTVLVDNLRGHCEIIDATNPAFDNTIYRRREAKHGGLQLSGTFCLTSPGFSEREGSFNKPTSSPHRLFVIQ